MGPPDPRQCLPLRGELRGRHPGTDFGAVQEAKAQRNRVAKRAPPKGCGQDMRKWNCPNLRKTQRVHVCLEVENFPNFGDFESPIGKKIIGEFPTLIMGNFDPR